MHAPSRVFRSRSLPELPSAIRRTRARWRNCSGALMRTCTGKSSDGAASSYLSQSAPSTGVDGTRDLSRFFPLQGRSEMIEQVPLLPEGVEGSARNLRLPCRFVRQHLGAAVHSHYWSRGCTRSECGPIIFARCTPLTWSYGAGRSVRVAVIGSRGSIPPAGTAPAAGTVGSASLGSQPPPGAPLYARKSSGPTSHAHRAAVSTLHRPLRGALGQRRIAVAGQRNQQDGQRAGGGTTIASRG